jgi:hypothetical protein
MRHLKVVLLTTVAACLLAVASAQAALPQFDSTFPNTFTSSSGESSFENEGSTLAIKCKKSEGKGEITGAKAATFDELFLECKATISGIPVASCKGLIDTVEGSILARGTSTLGYILGTLTPVVALTLGEEVHIICGSNLIIVKGCLVGTTTLGPSKTGELLFKGTKGAQELKDYTMDSGEMLVCELLSSTNGAAFKPSDQVQHAVLTFNTEVTVLD